MEENKSTGRVNKQNTTTKSLWKTREKLQGKPCLYEVQYGFSNASTATVSFKPDDKVPGTEVTRPGVQVQLLANELFDLEQVA